MKITVLCSSPEHPINSYLKSWIAKCSPKRDVILIRDKKELTGGDFLFLISCSEIVTAEDRAQYRYCLVLHASDLPSGRGWSPHIWDIVNGADAITLSLLEAEDKVDTGRIWQKRRLPISSSALWYEINHVLFENEIEMMEYAIVHHNDIIPQKQSDCLPVSYHRKRTPQDSMLDVEESIATQFDLIRACDPDRFPAYFIYKGRKFTLRIEAKDDE